MEFFVVTKSQIVLPTFLLLIAKAVKRSWLKFLKVLLAQLEGMQENFIFG